jgi:hypothetical protein
LTGQATRPADVFALLRSIYVDDAAFLRDFERLDIDTSGQRKRLAKYVLCQLETDASGMARDHDVDLGSIEHILPENPTEAWDTCFERERHADFVYRVGNLTLLEPSLNRQVGNQLLAHKLPVYATSAYVLTQALATAGQEVWTPDTLNARQAKLAQRAAHVWKTDFS